MRRTLLFAMLVLILPSQGRADARHEGYAALDALVGTWTIPGREATYRETCAWYHGERHVVCSTESKREDGSIGHSMSILGFVPGEGYVYTGIGSGGRYESHERGTFEDGILEYLEEAGGETTRIRVGPFTDRNVVPFQVHTSKNGTEWELVDSFDYARVR